MQLRNPDQARAAASCYASLREDRMAGRQQTDYAARLLRVLIYVQRNLDGDLSLETLAGRAAFSSYHFHRIFTAAMGETLGAHVRRLRLERAAMVLRGSAMSVTDAAFEAGYESVEAFSRAYRTAFGAAPSDHRRCGAWSPLAPAPSGVHFSRDGVVSRLRLNQEGTGLMNIREETLAAKRLLAMPHSGAYEAIGATFERLMAWGGPRGAFTDQGWVVGIYYDDPDSTPVEKLRSEACVECVLPPDPANGVAERILAGGKYAVMLHRGPYPTLGEAWRRILREWAVPHGVSLADRPCFERYLNDPREVAPEDLLTDIYLPIGD
jgi:AraC family transcriptional regulator